MSTVHCSSPSALLKKYIAQKDVQDQVLVRGLYIWHVQEGTYFVSALQVSPNHLRPVASWVVYKGVHRISLVSVIGYKCLLSVHYAIATERTQVITFQTS